jgi:hypothetical protein
MEDFYEVRSCFPIKDWRIDTELRIVYAERFMVVEKNVNVWYRTKAMFRPDIEATRYVTDVVCKNYEALRAPETFANRVRASVKLADEFYRKAEEVLTTYTEKENGQ